MRLLLAACLVLCGCPKKDPPAPPPVATPPARADVLPASPPSAEAMPPRPDAEVEIVGTWATEVKAQRHVLVAQVEPCLPVPATPTRLGEVTLETPGTLFAEFFFKQGTKAHVCVYGLDANGAVVGAVTMPDTPRTFEGLGELMVGPHAVTVKPLPAK